ncbi:nodulation protein NodH [Cognatishimia sp. F0-27]|uniref:sulfotransferase family 2 domain-containing protein n=1 Tax=Cognatishimia sp. F0-27 TaxID=2816855 RepID=UPI001D0C23C8|nr:nodulation protein NodH [Cognatishimia sp. F0-27]MCC1491290.1 nodulation protein NodH [Cognatishimia sp. F0-27]
MKTETRSGPFDCFVILGAMRTGSNFLEANLNRYEGIACHGEAFNPHFVGHPKTADLLGIDKATRDDDPLQLLNALRAGGPACLRGFRYFHDHDPRILRPLLDAPQIAKIILTRNPLDSYLSQKIARTTGQWMLTRVTRRKSALAHFDAQEFEAYLAAIQRFYRGVQTGLQHRGQVAFHIAHEDLADVSVLNGLVRWLGKDATRDSLDRSVKRQNPQPAVAKVSNPGDMRTALARLDPFALSTVPNLEPRRGPVVPSYLAGARTPLLYMPIRSGPEAAVTRWLAQLDGQPAAALRGGFTQQTLRAWKAQHPEHRSFTVIRHPLARAHRVFCDKILSTGPGRYARIRKMLIQSFDVPLPETMDGSDCDIDRHRDAFAGFLRFLKANLSEQTAVRVDAHWMSQAQCLQGMAEFALPDMIVRESEMAGYLPALALQVGHVDPCDPIAEQSGDSVPLSAIYDPQLEALARETYARDYLMFGFGDWEPELCATEGGLS